MLHQHWSLPAEAIKMLPASLPLATSVMPKVLHELPWLLTMQLLGLPPLPFVEPTLLHMLP